MHDGNSNLESLAKATLLKKFPGITIRFVRSGGRGSPKTDLGKCGNFRPHRSPTFSLDSLL
jgi:hypothetical protein